MGKLLYAFVVVALLSACSSSISLSETDLLDKAKQSGKYSLPPKADKIFADAEKASGSCKLEDAKWVESVKFADKEKSGIKRSYIFKKGVGEIMARSINQETLFYGHSMTNWWIMKGGRAYGGNLRQDDLINYLVNNWLAFCPPYKNLWRDVSVSEEHINGKAVYKITATEPYYQSPIVFWFDKQSKLLKGREYNNYDSSGTIMTVRDEFYDFRNVGGFKIPFKMIQYKDSKKWATVRNTDVAVNVGISEKLFTIPTKD